MSVNRGQAIGKYVIVAEAGRGGMAVVYHARDTVLDRDVALKLMAPHLALDPQFVERFMAEARAVARLKHPNIVTIYDVGQWQERPFLAMEFVAGGTLASILHQRGVLAPAYAANVLVQIASALDYAHAQKIVHRDIKPGNIIVGSNDHVTITDFGLAHALESTHVTQTGTLIGTPAYMSPEQITGQEVTGSSDQYSLGIVAYEMLTGVTPFRGDTSVVVLHDQVYTTPPPMRQINPRVPAGMERIVAKALAKKPAARYATAGAFATQFQAAAAKLPTTAFAPPRLESPQDDKTRVKGGWSQGQPPALTPATPAAAASRRAWLRPLLAIVAAVLLLVGLGVVLRTMSLGGGGRSESGGALASANERPPDQAKSSGLAILSATPGPTPSPNSTSKIAVALAATTEPSPSPAPTRTATSAPPTPTPTPTLSPTPLPPPTLPPSPAPPVVLVTGSFDGPAIDTRLWSVEEGGGSLGIGSGSLTLRSNGRRFPYISSAKFAFPADGDSQLKARFRYPELRDCGVGIIASSVLVPPGVGQAEAARIQEQAESDGVQVGVFQDLKNGLQVWFRSRGDRKDIVLPGPDTDWHDLIVRYFAGQYFVYLDGRNVYTSLPTPHRPQYVWMGHPADLGSNCLWSSLEVANVILERLP